MLPPCKRLAAGIFGDRVRLRMFLIDLIPIPLRHMKRGQFCTVHRVEKNFYRNFTAPFHCSNPDHRHRFLRPMTYVRSWLRFPRRVHQAIEGRNIAQSDVLAEVTFENHVERPLQRNSQFFLKSRKLHQVHRPPQHKSYNS